VRPELTILQSEVFGHRIDPNRAAIEMVTARSQPEDEILVNNEDIPFMFYTDNAIRGGIPCFRVDDKVSHPRFMVIRRSVTFPHWPVLIREIDRHKWNMIPVSAPDIPFGNTPDPEGQPTWWMLRRPQDLIVAERVGDIRIP
jgi:hypothetical protein